MRGNSNAVFLLLLVVFFCCFFKKRNALGFRVLVRAAAPAATGSCDGSVFNRDD